MKRKYWNCLAMGALSLAMLLAGCGGGDTTSSAQPSAPTESADVTQAQTESETITLKVGTHGSFSPYAFVDENSDDPQGFEVDVMNEIAKRANLEVDIQVAEWNGVFGMLDAGQLDKAENDLGKIQQLLSQDFGIIRIDPEGRKGD